MNSIDTAQLSRPLALAPSGFERVQDGRATNFASVLGKVSAATGTPEQRARAAAEQIVATALVQPILKQLRETSMAAAPFLPTQGEKQFQGLMDTQVSQQIVHAKSFPLVDRIESLLLSRQAETKETRR